LAPELVRHHIGRIASLFELTSNPMPNCLRPPRGSFFQGKVRWVFSAARREAGAFRRDLDNESAYTANIVVAADEVIE
jgi:hypothetical protein